MTTRGSLQFTFSDMVRDTIQTHGIAWAVDYYITRHGLSRREFRIFSGI